jgi:hypothetical protein
MSDKVDPTQKSPTKDAPTSTHTIPAGLSNQKENNWTKNWKYIHEKEKGTL